MNNLEILEKILKNSGLSQEVFAESLGYKKSTFNNYLKGRREIPQELIQKLNEIYNVNPAIFFDNTASLYIENETKTPSRDLDKMLDEAMSFDGKPMSENDRAVIRAYLEGKFGNK